MQLDEANCMLEPGHLPFESGVKCLADGKLYVAVLTPMPNITREMLVHWFSTMKTFERYKPGLPRWITKLMTCLGGSAIRINAIHTS